MYKELGYRIQEWRAEQKLSLNDCYEAFDKKYPNACKINTYYRIENGNLPNVSDKLIKKIANFFEKDAEELIILKKPDLLAAKRYIGNYLILNYSHKTVDTMVADILVVTQSSIEKNGLIATLEDGPSFIYEGRWEVKTPNIYIRLVEKNRKDEALIILYEDISYTGINMGIFSGMNIHRVPFSRKTVLLKLPEKAEKENVFLKRCRQGYLFKYDEKKLLQLIKKVYPSQKKEWYSEYQAALDYLNKKEFLNPGVILSK